MMTVGGAISGYWATGSTCAAMRPASVMMIEMTPAKIGRLMKNSENDIAATLFRDRRRAGFGCRRLRRLDHRGAGLDLQKIVDDDPVSGLEPGHDGPIRVDPVAGLHRPRLRLALGIEYEHQILLLGLNDRGLRHEEDVVALAGGDAHGNELARQKLLARIVEFGAQLLRAEAGIDRGGSKVEASLGREERAVGEQELHVRIR